ncbi:MAG TPA: pyridoxamine 5'-phosphate oxidase family protein [Burkholderiaceae bacterium]|nr:pyridoxamine 5'-phosphate oxidase family protein [Burkholderiaceae bacterium]HQR69759.1 pyridoxamine 5'-phosphate oxidase family protein [Burkholderiaceae bacterium]
MSKLYRSSHRELQARYDTTRLADRIEATLFREQFTAEDRAFIERLDMFFLATADAEGRPSCSFKGGDPGFVRVTGEAELVFPCFDGNGMFLSMGNAAENPSVGLLFIDFESPKRLRVNGTAELAPAASVSPPYVEAQFIVRVAVREIFPNCPRYLPRLQRVEPSKFVPRAGMVTPVPAWKRMDWAKDVLPAGDPARDPDRS